MSENAKAAVLLVLFAAFPASASATKDPRSTELLRYGCRSELSRREITLFANGTVRLRQGALEDQQLYLHELSPEALEDQLRVLRGTYSENDTDRIREAPSVGVGSDWSATCEVFMEMPEHSEPLRYRFSAHDIPPLRISRLIHVAEELVDLVAPAVEPERLGPDYEPAFGDVLRDKKGMHYRVVGLMTGFKGSDFKNNAKPSSFYGGAGDRNLVEIQGVEEPLRMFVDVDDLREMFVAVEKNGPSGYWEWQE